MTRWRGLLLILLAFGLLAVIYSLTTPLFEAPDEPWHYAYVRWVAEGHGLPRPDDDASGANQEVAQPPLYYLIAALFSGPVADDDLAELFWHNPQFGYQAGGTVNDNKNMLIHTARERFPWHDAVLAVRLARLASLAFGLLTVGATYGLAHEALPDQPLLPLVAASIVAFTPQFLFISGVVSNDSATAATATCALWALARIVRLGPTPRRAVGAGLALGLALLSKTSTLLLLPLALLALWLAYHRQALARGADTSGDQGTARRQPTPFQHTLTRWGGYAARMLGLAGLVSGWWYLRNWIAFGDPLMLSVHVNTPWGRTMSPSLMTLLSELPQVFRSFWGAFGWGHIELPPALYLILAGLVTFALLGWVHYLSQLGKSKTRPRPLIAYISLLAALWFLGVLAALLRWMWQVEAPHGRLLFPALGGWALLLTVGWSRLGAGIAVSLPLPPTRRPQQDASVTARSAKDDLPLVSVALLFLLSVLVPPAIIRPAFAQPRLLSPTKATRQVTPQNLDYGDRARLLGYRVAPESVKAGQQIQVTLCWEALKPMDKDYTLFIHLLGQDNLRVAERTTFPGQGRFPTSLWPVGRAFCETLAMHVAPWAPAPELYALEVGLYDAAYGKRLPVPDEPPTVGLVRVTPRPDSAHTWTTPTHTLSYELGGQIGLVGYNSSTSLASSDTFTLTLYWQAHQVPPGDYKVFVHLLDETGEIVAQDDTPPRGGRYPTWAWQPGDLVPDTHQLDLPAERAPGPYRLFVGMYHPETGERLPVVGPEGPVPNDAIRLSIGSAPVKETR